MKAEEICGECLKLIERELGGTSICIGKLEKSDFSVYDRSLSESEIQRLHEDKPDDLEGLVHREKKELLRLCIKGGGIWCVSELDKDDAKDLGKALIGAAGLIS